MTSIITNRLALEALRALNAANEDVAASQKRISTGLRVAGPKDNAAVYTIAQNTRADLGGRKAVDQSLARAGSVLDIAATGASAISDLLIEVKSKAIAYADPSLSPESRGYLLNDMRALVAQISSTARNSTFDGVGLLAPRFDPSVTLPAPTGGGPSPDLGFTVPMARGPGVVTTSFVWENAAPTPTLSVDGVSSYQFGVGPPATSSAYSVGFRYGDWTDFEIIGAPDIDFAFHADPHPIPPPPATPPPAAYGVVLDSVTFSPLRTKESLLMNPAGEAMDVYYRPMTADWLGLDNLDVLTPQAILDRLGEAIEAVHLSAAYLGTQQRLVENLRTQNSRMQDELEGGLGNLVDADLAKEAAHQQAAQVKQQLAAKTLSIANAQPGWLLDLFKG